MASRPSPPPKSPAVSATEVTRSKLPLDIMRLVFERLGFADFERAKSVCSSWQSASRQSKPNNQIPWMILFPKDKNYGLLFNPAEKDKVYKTQDLVNDFARSFCVATYRSWLLMLDPLYTDDFQYNFYILDLLTRERINLPILESEFGLKSPVFWIDEKTKDYLVIGMFGEENAVSLKKGDNSWKQVPQLSGIEECFNMVYKDHKLYCLNYCKLKIFDFSGEIPVKVFRISVGGYIKPLLMFPGRIPHNFSWTRMKNNVVVTVSGQVLIVNCIRWSMSKIWNFEIYKMDSSKGNEWEEIFLWETRQFFWIWVPQCSPRTLKESRETRSTSMALILKINMMKTIVSYSILIQRRLNNHTNLFVRPFHALMHDGSYHVSNGNNN